MKYKIRRFNPTCRVCETKLIIGKNWTMEKEKKTVIQKYIQLKEKIQNENA